MNRPDTDAQDQLLQIITFGLQRAAGPYRRAISGSPGAPPASYVRREALLPPQIVGFKPFVNQPQSQSKQLTRLLRVTPVAPATGEVLGRGSEDLI